MTTAAAFDPSAPVNWGAAPHPTTPVPPQMANMVNGANRTQLAGSAALPAAAPIPTPAPIAPGRATVPAVPAAPVLFDPAAPSPQLQIPASPPAVKPQDPKAKEAEEKKKADEAQEKKRDILRKISMVVAPILLVLGIGALCFAVATAITGFGWVGFSIALILGVGCLAGTGLTTYFGLIRIKKATPPENNTPKPAGT